MKRDVDQDRDRMARARRRVLAGAGLIALACLSAASPAGADAGAGIVFAREAAPERVLSANDLAGLPTVQVTIPVEPGHAGPNGPAQRTFEGPLLWTVLDRAGVIEAAKVRDQVRQTVLITGRDGYTAVLALGEIAPEFEGKQVIVAERADGQPFAPENLRLVVPGDKRGGRGVHDIARIAVAAVRAEPR